MRFFITFFCFVLIACVANITQAEPVIETEDAEWKQIESELNADWDVDIKNTETTETEEAQDKKEDPQKADSSKIWPFAAGYLLGKTSK